MKVMICDDSLLVRKKLRECLEEIGCEVCEAGNGAEAVALYQTEHPSIVFMDIVMPKVDGLTALRMIKEADNKARVIMLSSAGTSNKLLEALKSGASDFIQKPYTHDQIRKAVAATDC
jgi:two-component system chemotaxis response regulator CheY